MKITYHWFGILFILCTFGLASCDKKDDVQLVSPSHKEINLSCGVYFAIPILTDQWSVESVVCPPSSVVVLDKDGQPLTLLGNETAEAANGWLTLTRDVNNALGIGLKENFDRTNERKLMICVKDAKDHRDYITIAQRAGSAYELIKAEYQEVFREIYTNADGCSEYTWTNNSPEEVWHPIGYIFKDVVETSIFESDDYGAFDWVPEEGLELVMPELIIDEYSRGESISVYQKGTTTIISY